MTTQPEALRLADAMESGDYPDDYAVAAELRRLHNLAMELQGKIYALEMARSIEQKTAKLKRDALLEALKELMVAADGVNAGPQTWLTRARAAIKAAEEKNKYE